jgi:DNA-binding IclR family transcriptional regulator
MELPHQRLLAHFQRAPGDHYTTAQLARTVGWSISETQRRLAELEAEGYVARSPATSYPTFELTPQALPPGRAPVRHDAPSP